MEDKYDRMVDESVEKLFQNISYRLSPEDMHRITDAYELAKEAHKDQRRKSGEPYIMHPIAVARIVAEELELGANPIIAAFLHDVVEDTNYSIEDIRNRFGEDVEFLVGVVTKKKKEKYDYSKQVDNYKQILKSVQFDIRAILLKLADRLHNMRTLQSMRPDKQMKIAGETDYFYAPLANRLGLYHVKTELENLSFKYRCPRDYINIENQLKREMMNDRERLDLFCDKIDRMLTAKGIMTRIEVRYRTPYSVWRKMQRKGIDYYHADYRHYIRIIYATDALTSEKEMSLKIYSILSDNFKERPGSLANYVNAPKENGYQSFHIKILSDQGTWEEIHISSERMVRNSRLGCTAERTEANVKSWIDKFRSVLEDMANDTESIDYMDGVTSSFYNDDIMVFTPKGQGIILPKDATALDFAFELHSELGPKAAYARINGRLSSLKTVLQRGDCVEIGKDETATPEHDWLNHVHTYKAKRILRNYFANSKQLEYNRCPHCNPLPGDEVIGFKEGREKLTIHKRNCPIAIRLASQQGDSIVSVEFKKSEDFLYPVRIRIRSVDRYHLLIELVKCITEKQNLSISRLVTETIDHLVECTIDFQVHSADELNNAIKSIAAIKSVDEVDSVPV